MDNDIFLIHRDPRGWQACVTLDWWALQPTLRFCRSTTDPETAQRLLACLRRELTKRPGKIAPVVEAWRRREICI